jgi:hypothetical protein
MKPRRALFVGVLVAVVAVAVVVGNAKRPRPDASAAAPVASGLPAESPRAGSVWFCPGLPSGLAVGDDRVTISNVGDAPADVVVTVLPDKGQRTEMTFTVGASSVATKARRDLGPPGALTMEAFGGRIAIEEGIDGPAGTDITPCATQGAAQWNFAAGTTPRGVQQWLVLENPFASDAKVDVTLRTSGGVRQPERLQSFDVRRRSRAVIALHDIAVREDRVAVQVDALAGRVVAAQTLVFTTNAGLPGIAMTLGAPTSSDRWLFADGATATGATTRLAIANVGAVDADVDVQILPENNQVVAAVTLSVAQDEVVWAQLGGCAPAGGADNCVPAPANVSYAVDVHTEAGAAIVAQTLTRGAGDSARPGAATSLGSPQPARSWVFARDRVDRERSTTLAILNPLAQPARVDISVVHDGTVEHPAGFQGVIVPPGHRASVHVVGGRRPSAAPNALIVDASAPVVVERSIVGTRDTSRSLGIAVG